MWTPTIDQRRTCNNTERAGGRDRNGGAPRETPRARREQQVAAATIHLTRNDFARGAPTPDMTAILSNSATPSSGLWICT